MTSVETYRAIVEACDQAIQQRLSEDECIVSFTIDGETVTKHGLSEILATRKLYVNLWSRAARAATGGSRTIANLGNR